MSAKVRVASVTTPNATPRRPGTRTARGTLGGTWMRTIATTTMLAMRLTAKTARQPLASMRIPPMTGPMPKPSAMPIDVSATARVRSPGSGYASRTSAIAEGVITAAPAPATTWPAMTMASTGATAAIAAPPAKTAVPSSRTRRAPSPSASAPAGSSRLAKAMA